ncbi:MAG: hypothetical protein IJ409_00185 [Lachnospiraceae bacterium]|nr:hypothetical protein [Lachnospiraceae bacterium]
MAAMTGFLAVYYIIMLAFLVAIIVATWKIFVKAGRPGWASLIPFYSQYCLFDIAWGNGWLFLLCFIPCAGFVFPYIAYYKLAKAFGQGTGFGIGMIFLCPIFMLILGFGKAEYIGPQ